MAETVIEVDQTDLADVWHADGAISIHFPGFVGGLGCRCAWLLKIQLATLITVRQPVGFQPVRNRRSSGQSLPGQAACLCRLHPQRQWPPARGWPSRQWRKVTPTVCAEAAQRTLRWPTHLGHQSLTAKRWQPPSPLARGPAANPSAQQSPGRCIQLRPTHRSSPGLAGWYISSSPSLLYA